MVQDWTTITLEALQSAWQGFLLFLPRLIGAIVVMVIGWFMAEGIGRLVSEILKRLRVDKVFEKTNWKESLEKADLKVSVSDFLGDVCKWVLAIVFLLASVEILGLVQFAEFLRGILLWLPNLIVTAAIFVVAVVVAEILEKVIKAGAKKMEISYAGLLGTLVKGSIYIFTALAILSQLGVTPVIINALVFGLVATISLALGLSFGLGGKETAAKILEDLRKKVSEK